MTKDTRERKSLMCLLLLIEEMKVQRKQYYDETSWYWGRIYGEVKAWMPLPEPYKEN